MNHDTYVTLHTVFERNLLASLIAETFRTVIKCKREQLCESHNYMRIGLYYNSLIYYFQLASYDSCNE